MNVSGYSASTACVLCASSDTRASRRSDLRRTLGDAVERAQRRIARRDQLRSEELQIVGPRHRIETRAPVAQRCQRSSASAAASLRQNAADADDVRRTPSASSADSSGGTSAVVASSSASLSSLMLRLGLIRVRVPIARIVRRVWLGATSLL